MDGHLQRVSTSADEVTKAIKDVGDPSGRPGSPLPSTSEVSVQVLAQRDRELKDLNEDSYSFDDWNTRAYAAYSAGRLEDAAYFWLKAAGVPNAGTVKVARALVNRGATQNQMGQHKAALTTYDEILRRFGDATEPALREQVARALFNKGATQGQMGQHKAALTTYDEILRRFGEATELALREQVARALFNIGDTQDQLTQHEAALATYDELLRRFGEATEPALREPVAKALLNKGATQAQLGQHEAALATYDEVLRRFGEVTEPALRDSVAIALNSIGFAQLVQAKAQRQGSDPAASSSLQTALASLDKAVERGTQPNGVVLGNRAYVRCLLGDVDGAEADFDAALRAPIAGGRELYEATLKDLETHPLPEDATMRELVERAWRDYQQSLGGASSTE